jgi:plasmid stabilization system protein ParE
MPKLIFHPDIRNDIQDSYDWYQNQSLGLGDLFLNELEAAFMAIKELPKAWPIFETNFRRYILDKFPYSVIYSPRESSIYILVIMHNSRKPGYWKDRV